MILVVVVVVVSTGLALVMSQLTGMAMDFMDPTGGDEVLTLCTTGAAVVITGVQVVLTTSVVLC